jgi:type IV pilus assembly protein PilB
LVLSTMHTNNAIQAVTRLVEIGVEPFLVAPAVIGVMAQRLVRKICSNCKESYKLTAEQKSNLFIWNAPQEVIFYRGTGCRDCFKTGYSGRIAIHELFVLDELARKMVARNLSILEIQKYALERGFQTLRYDGMKKVLRGLTTIEELNRVTIEEFNF